MTIIIPMYAIRHNPSGGYLPKPQGRNGRGGSHMDPAIFDGTKDKKHGLLPRMWSTKPAAKAALTSWLRGKVICYRSSGGYPDYDHDEDNKLLKVLERKREDMEIVIIEVVLP